MKKIIAIITVLVLSGISCQKTEFLKADFVKIYMQQSTYQNNILVFDAFKTEDDGFIIFAVEGNVNTIYERVNTIEIMKVNSNGNLEWDKSFDDFDFGFPTNIIEVENGFDLFWSDESEIQEINFELSDTDTISISKRTVTCNFNEYNCDNAYKITTNTATPPYIYMNFGNDDQGFYTFVANSDENSPNLLGQYITDPEEIFPNLDQYNPATRFDRNFWIDSWNSKFYINAPYQQSFALLELGNRIPIYQDEHYWIADYLYKGTNNPEANELAAIITPRNLRSEEGIVYFSPTVSLEKTNQDFSSIPNKVELPGVNMNNKIIVLPFNDLFLVAATSSSGTTLIYVIDESAKIIRTHIFGDTNSYEVSALRINESGTHFALIGTTEVNGRFQRAFLIKIPVQEIL